MIERNRDPQSAASVRTAAKTRWAVNTGLVYVPILRSGCAMEVDDELQAMVACPANRFAKISELALNVRFTARDVPSPVADR